MNKIAFVFPGQGSQYIGMGKDFYNNFTESRKIFDEASELLDIDMKELVFHENDKINITEFTQIAMVTTCVALSQVVKKLGLVPNVCAGLSLGEYSALINSGVLSFKDGLDIVRKRGILMDNALPKGISTMAAVIGLSGEEVLGVCNEIEGSGIEGLVTVANYNCPGQVVITGEKTAVEVASTRLKEIGARRIIPLNVSGAFHSPLLKEAGEELLVELEAVSINDPLIPYLSNVTGDYIYDNSLIKELLSHQVYSPVKWQQSVGKIIASGVNTFIEIGPGRTLSNFIRKIDSTCKTINIDKIEGLDKLQEVIDA